MSAVQPDQICSSGVPSERPEPRPFDESLFRVLAVLLGISWSITFILVGCHFGLQMYGDGSIFSYAIAADEAWAFHWHNISGRIFVYLLTNWPAEVYVQLTGNAQAGVVLHGLLFFSAPLIGLFATHAFDRSEHGSFFLHACVSTAVICPLVFGFPTEMWVAHSVFWPTLAASHTSKQGYLSGVLAAGGLTALMLSHGGGVVLAGVLVASTILRGKQQSTRAVIGLGIATSVWAVVLFAIRPDPYIAKVINSAAFSFIDLRNLMNPVLALMFLSIVGYIAFVRILEQTPLSHAARELAFVIVFVTLAIYYRLYDDNLLADARYPLRTTLLVMPPIFTASALLGISEIQRVHPSFRHLRALAHRFFVPSHLIAALVLVASVHIVETTKFVLAWGAYKQALAALATGDVTAPLPGSPNFVSSAQISDQLNRLAWSSTTHYLSILVSPGLAPSRLVVSPYPAYSWLDCETASKSLAHSTAIPMQSRVLIHAYACLH